VANGFECEIRVDYVGTVAKEQCEVLNFTRLTGLEHDGYAGACALADEVVVEASYCEKCRDRCFLGANLAVR